MSITRANLFEGPAIVQINGATLYSKDNVVVELYRDTNPINVAAYGKVDERVKDIGAKITLTPGGQWTSTILAALYPHTNPVIGASLMGSSDVPVTVWPLNGKGKYVFSAGCVTKMPDLTLNSTDAPFGSMEIMCGLANTTERSGTAALYTYTATASFTDTSFTTTEIFTPFYAAALAGGSAPWDSFVCEKGVQISFAMQSHPRIISGYGTVDYRLDGLEITVKLIPAGFTEANVMSLLPLQGSGVAMGVSLAASAANLTIAGSGTGVPTITINKAALRRAPHVYGAKDPRFGELEFVATRATGGTMFSVGVTS